MLDLLFIFKTLKGRRRSCNSIDELRISIMTDSQKIKLWAHAICVSYYEPNEADIDSKKPISTKESLDIGNYLEDKYGYERTTKVVDRLIQKYKGILYPELCKKTPVTEKKSSGIVEIVLQSRREQGL